jgi:hypothetical protein
MSKNEFYVLNNSNDKFVLGYKLEITWGNTEVRTFQFFPANVCQPVLNLQMVVTNSLYSIAVSCRKQRLCNRTTAPFVIKTSRMLSDAHNLCRYENHYISGNWTSQKKKSRSWNGVFPNGDKVASSSGALDGRTGYSPVYTCIYSTILGASAKQAQWSLRIRPKIRFVCFFMNTQGMMNTVQRRPLKRLRMGALYVYAAIRTDVAPLVGGVSANFCGWRVPHGQS